MFAPIRPVDLGGKQRLSTMSFCWPLPSGAERLLRIPANAQVCAKGNNEESIPELRHTIVRGAQNTTINEITLIGGNFAVAKHRSEAGVMIGPSFAATRRNSWSAKPVADVVKVWTK
jgi:hypothetical protein